MAIASIPASNEGTTEFPAHFEQVNAAKGVTLRHFGQLCYEKVDKYYWLSFSLNKVNRYTGSHINSNKKKERYTALVWVWQSGDSEQFN